MQIFFALARTGIDGKPWSKRRFEATVTEFLKAQPGAQFEDLHATTGWDMYKALIPVADDAAALALRKRVEALCTTVSPKCKPYYFRRRKLDVDSIDQLSLFGLTGSESREFRDKAPPGTPRYIDV